VRGERIRGTRDENQRGVRGCAAQGLGMRIRWGERCRGTRDENQMG
jgi:hypothetical protein